MAEAAARLSVRGLSKTYPGAAQPSVDGVDLDVEQGAMLALLGPSGCGKTTTLRMIAGLVEPSAGTISVAGEEITRRPVHQRGMGMVFQSFALFPHLDVARNVAFGLEMRRVPKARAAERVEAALEKVALRELAGRRVSQLSGGQQQRVALARALVIDPTLLLLDEPLSALDAKLRESLRTQIRDIQQASGTTAVFVTHDQDEALSMADQVAVMNEGRVVQVGTPKEIYENPATVFVATFIGRANLFRGTLRKHGAGAALDTEGLGVIGLPATPLASGTEVSAVVRPQSVQVHESGAAADTAPGEAVTRYEGVVAATSYTGDQIGYRVRVGDTVIESEQSSHAVRVLAPGTPVTVSWPRRNTLVLER
ncbi:ABC transporter ATP-binding protein [Streptomyces mayteni]